MASIRAKALTRLRALQPAANRRANSSRLAPSTLLGGMAALFVAALFANIGMGAVEIPPAQAIAIILSHAGLDIGVEFEPRTDAILWNIRLPRIALGILVGGSLGIAGAALQGVFRNPLAEPGIIGVSSGAAAGAVGAIVLGFSVFQVYGVAVAAFLAGLLATTVVYSVARAHGQTSITTLILAGIAVNATAGAVTGLFVYIADDDQLRSITFWTLGHVGGATWPVIWSILPFFLLGFALLPFWAQSLNLLTLGDREARHMGVATERVRLGAIVLSALLTGAAVSVAGIIAFVGLVVPHVIRLLAGPDHRFLLPASILGGAITLLLADLIARTVVVPAELPLGVVTAMIGGPFFLWLVHRTRMSWGGME